MNTKELDFLNNEIGGLISAYSSLGSDFKDIDRLIVAKRKLSGYIYRFSVLVGESLEDYNNASSDRKVFLAQRQLEILNNGSTQFKANLMAEAESIELRKIENISEAIYRRVKSQFDSCSDILQSIMQDISTLKKELENVKSDN